MLWAPVEGVHTSIYSTVSLSVCLFAGVGKLFLIVNNLVTFSKNVTVSEGARKERNRKKKAEKKVTKRNCVRDIDIQ